MPKWNGGVIGVANNPTQSSAKGIWSLSEATKAIRAGLWPPSNAGADPYFENVTMLLSGDGTNGAQNNTFLDSSTNNFTITRNGNTTQGTFTPFSKPDGRWSNYFDGNGDYLTVASNAAFGYGTGDFTIEFWYYPTSFAASSLPIILDQRSGQSNEVVPTIYTETNGTLHYYVNGANRITGTALTTNTWYHIAVARSGTSTKMFVNGAQVGSTYTDTNTYVTSNVGIGANAGSPSGYYIFGYLSNLRIVKGTAVYTAAFTTPTAPLTAITNTSLLTCQSNRFIDNSTNAFAITRNGDTSIQTFSPFPTLTAYASGTNGGSGYFDGTGDFLSAATNAAFNFGSGAFTIEFWYYPTTLSGTQCLITNYGGSTTGFVIQMGGSTAGSGRIDAGFSGDGADITSTNAVQLNSWNHIAISGTPGATGIKLFINGAQEGSTYTGATSLDTSSTLLIGEVASTNRLSGYLCGLRLLKGTAQYTTTFTPPTAPLTAITNTSLLLSGTNGGIIDNAMSNVLETVGNAQISTTQSKFGGASMYFDGNGDALAIPNSRYYDFSSGDFTVEFWFRTNTLTPTPPSGGASGFAFIIGQTNWNGTNSGNGWCLFQKNQTLEFYAPASTLASIVTGNVITSTSTWYHIAIVRSGTATNNTKIYVNGTQEAQGTPTVSYSTRPLMVGGIGATYGWDTDYIVNGYIDDLRITKGYARYTANFTVPSAPFVTFGD